MKTLTLDYSKWRCGGPEENDLALGKGATELLNEKGYMCCLGQFSLQLDKELNMSYILGLHCLQNIKKIGRIPLLTKKIGKAYFQDTSFTDVAMEINDTEETTPIQKISKLRSLLKKYKYKLKVINKK